MHSLKSVPEFRKKKLKSAQVAESVLNTSDDPYSSSAISPLSAEPYSADLIASWYSRDIVDVLIKLAMAQNSSHDSYSLKHIVVLSVFSSLAILSVFLRFWSRRLQRLALDLSDYLIIPGLV